MSLRVGEDLLRAAIDYRRCMAVTYHYYSRVIEPYALGTDGHGKRILLVYQVSGGDESGEPLGWKLLAIDELMGATILGDCTRIDGRELPTHLLEAIGVAALGPSPAADRACSTT